MSRYIDADALKEWLDEYLSVFKKYDKGTIKGFVDHAPTIEPKRGENLKSEYPSLFECSVCGASCDDTIPWDCDINFCPYCGADMREREGE